MRKNYHGLRNTPRQRRIMLVELCAQMGASAFSEFLIDALAQEGGALYAWNLPTLAIVWQAKRRAENAIASTEALEGAGAIKLVRR